MSDEQDLIVGKNEVTLFSFFFSRNFAEKAGLNLNLALVIFLSCYLATYYTLPSSKTGHGKNRPKKTHGTRYIQRNTGSNACVHKKRDVHLPFSAEKLGLVPDRFGNVHCRTGRQNSRIT